MGWTARNRCQPGQRELEKRSLGTSGMMRARIVFDGTCWKLVHGAVGIAEKEGTPAACA